VKRCAGCQALEARVAVVEALIRANRLNGPADAQALLTVAEAADGQTFTAGALWCRALVNEGLRVALQRAGVQSARDMGLWFRRLHGVPIEGVRLVKPRRRGGAGNNWLVVVADLASSADT
jgi:hypothetical protein